MDGFILGVVSDEVTIPVYELTKTMAHKTQTPARTRNDRRLYASRPPVFIDPEMIDWLSSAKLLTE